MFEKRFTTSTVATEIPLDIQLLIYSMIDTWKAQKQELDYLQVFELSIANVNGQPVQKIIHRQEVPPRKTEALFKVDTPINERLWVVDSSEGAVMMYPEEY